jgi:SRSO17 transposase
VVEVLPSLPTAKFIDEYCQWYQDLFPEVRSFEAFKALHLGMIAEIKRKTLPAIAKVVGLQNHQSLHHFLTESPWSSVELKERRLELIKIALRGRPIVLIIDETGDRKKGNQTDYVKRQYIGNLGKTDNGIVVVTAYGLISGMTFPLKFEIYKPKERLQPGDIYRSKTEIAASLTRELQAMGFRFNLVLADSLYGESQPNFLKVLEELQLKFIVAIRSNHTAWTSGVQQVKYLKWQKFQRVFSDLSREVRYIREIICGQRGEVKYWQITTDPEKLPANSTWYVMSKYPDITAREVGNFYGLRTWIEYGFKQSKDELGWADFRLTHYAQIEKWWELVCSAYLMVSLRSEQLLQSTSSTSSTSSPLAKHPQWDGGKGWKNLLNNLRLMIQPMVFFYLIQPWLTVFPIPHLSAGLWKLQKMINCVTSSIFVTPDLSAPYFSSA